MAKIPKASVPGVGKVDVTNLTSLISLFGGLFLLAAGWMYANRAVSKVQGMGLPRIGRNGDAVNGDHEQPYQTKEVLFQ